MPLPRWGASRILAARDDIDGMHDARDVTQQRQNDVDPELLAHPNLKENPKRR